MMKNITVENAVEIINSFGSLYTMELDSLQFLIKDKTEFECLQNDDILMIMNPREDATYVTIIPFHPEFNISDVVKTIKSKCDKAVILLNTYILKSDFIDLFEREWGNELVAEGIGKDYIHTGGEVKNVDNKSIRVLTEPDKDIFVACTDESMPYRPPLAVLFDVFVNRGHGQILAAFEDEKIIGYLSFIEISETFYDVDYVYVVPHKRNLGIGNKLAKAYVEYANKHNHTAYWSNAKNEASENTAKACGFELIREVRIYELYC